MLKSTDILSSDHQLLLIDLDDTLIDTSSFKDNMFTSLSSEANSDIDKISEAYDLVKKETKMKNGWVSSFSNKISYLGSKKPQFYSDLIYSLIDDIAVDSVLFNFVKELDQDKIIYTYGDRSFQSAKIRKLGLRKYFNDVIITSEDKCDYLISKIHDNKMELLGNIYEKILILEDKPDLYKKLENIHWISVVEPTSVNWK